MSGRRRLSTSARVSLAMITALALGVAALATMAYLRVSDRMLVDLDVALVREADAYSAALQQPERQGLEDLQSSTRAYLSARSVTAATTRPVLLVRFSDGKVITNSEVALERAAENSAALDVARAKRAFIDVSYRGTSYRAATVPVADTSGTVLAVFEAALPTTEAQRLLAELFWTLTSVGALVLLVGAGVSTWVARASLSPLRRAADTAGRVTQSSLTERIDYDGADDEVGALVRALNDMLDRLEGSFGEQRRFVADASHELRTPLQVILGHLEILSHDDLGEGEREEELELLRDEAGRMTRLVDDLLALARLESGTPRPHQRMDVSILLAEAGQRAKALGDRAFTVNAEPGLWVDGDPDQLMQALLNLVGNAVDHTPERGTIALRSCSVDGHVVIDVADNGEGIRTEDLPRIFDRLYRAQGPRGKGGGGSGLGLAIARRLIELHGGTVTAANRKTGGAVFTIRLPQAEPPAPEPSV